MSSSRKGFTLVELMVVIVIIGILSALAIPKFLGATNKAKLSEFKPVLKQIYTLENAFNQEKDTFTTDLTVVGFSTPDASSRFSYSVPGVSGTTFNAEAAIITAIGAAGTTVKFTLQQDGSQTGNDNNANKMAGWAQ